MTLRNATGVQRGRLERLQLAKQPFIDSSEIVYEAHGDLQQDTYKLSILVDVPLNLAIIALLILVVFVPIKVRSFGLLQGDLKTILAIPALRQRLHTCTRRSSSSAPA